MKINFIDRPFVHLSHNKLSPNKTIFKSKTENTDNLIESRYINVFTVRLIF